MEERNKRLSVSKVMKQKRQETLERITTEYGTQLRMNRSIQAEGSFSETKDGMGFRRYLSAGIRNVTMESVIIAMAHNINKLHAKLQSGWHPHASPLYDQISYTSPKHIILRLNLYR